MKLRKEDSTEFTVQFAPFTASRVDRVLSILDKYNDTERSVNQLLVTADTAPAMLEKGGTMEQSYPLLQKYLSGAITREQAKEQLYAVINSALSYQNKKDNLQVLYEVVQIMILETTLSKEELELVKSPIGGEFWGNQDALLMRDTGEKFRSQILEFTK